MRLGALTSASVLSLLLAATATASAQEGRCAALGGTGFTWEPGVLDSVDPAELESPDPESAPLPTPIPVRDALACAGGNDVRCQPLHEGSTPDGPRLATTGPDGNVAAFAAALDTRIPIVLDVFGRVALLGAGRDATRELLRPPRR